jgi:hypothetical protein
MNAEPIDDVIARARAPYTHGYGDSGQAAMDAETILDAYEALRDALCGGPTEPPLTLNYRGSPNSIDFSDERARAGHDVDQDAIASVTLSGADESWGEFMNRTDLLALRSWIDRILSAPCES